MPSARWRPLIASASFMAGCSGSAKLTPPDSVWTPLNTIVQITSSSSPEAGTPDAMCPPTLTTCGGDPTGTWRVAASCLAPSPPTSAAGSCAGVSFVATDLRSWTGGVPSLTPQFSENALDQGSVTFNADHSYESAIGGATEGSYHFESSCLGVYHAQDCSTLASTLQGVLPPNYLGVSCTADASGDGGCDCSYRFVTVIADEGTWNVSGAMLTLNSSVQGATQTADLCASGASLQMGASAVASLFGAKLQSIWLTKDADASP
jgi:hypothetical protein